VFDESRFESRIPAVPVAHIARAASVHLILLNVFTVVPVRAVLKFSSTNGTMLKKREVIHTQKLLLRNLISEFVNSTSDLVKRFAVNIAIYKY
jgi:hypothetical protein